MILKPINIDYITMTDNRYYVALYKRNAYVNVPMPYLIRNTLINLRKLYYRNTYYILCVFSDLLHLVGALSQ